MSYKISVDKIKLCDDFGVNVDVDFHNETIYKKFILQLLSNYIIQITPIIMWEHMRVKTLEKILENHTELKDKNGKLIYEGDIVKQIRFDKPFSSNRKPKEVFCIIQWDKGNMGFNISPINKKETYNCYEKNYKEPYFDLEIIGNIHENPKLLEKNNEF